MHMDPILRALADRQGGVFTHQQAEQAGYPHEEIRRQIAVGRWVRTRHGVIAEPAAIEAARAGGRRALALLQLRSVLVRVGPSVVASHESCGLVQGLPVARIPRVATLTSPTSRARVAKGYSVARAALPKEDLVEVDGFRTTSVARCVLDLARGRRLLDGLIAADAALRTTACTREELTDVLARQAHWPGQAQAARVINLADGRAGSPGETELRLFVLEEDLPTPELGMHVVGASGTDYVTDLGWEGLRTIGEFDGRGKYVANVSMGPDHPLWQEKVREDDMRAAGWQVVRVVHEDFDHRSALKSRFLTAFDRSLRAA